MTSIVAANHRGEVASRCILTYEYGECCQGPTRQALLIGAPALLAARVRELFLSCTGNLISTSDRADTAILGCEAVFLFFDSTTSISSLSDEQIQEIRVELGAQHVCATFLSTPSRGKAKLRMIGADSYLVGPIAAADVLSQFLASAGCERLLVGQREANHPIEIDLRSRSVTLAGQRVHLSPIEYRLLLVLATLNKPVVLREDLRDYLWPCDKPPELRTVDVQVARLRSRLQQVDHRFSIASVRGWGYSVTVNGR